MKTTALIFFLVGVSSLLSAQNPTIMLADREYELYNYDAARKLYQDVFRKKASYGTAKRVAECYRKQEMYKEAERWYARVVAYREHTGEDSYQYLLMLRMNGKYEEAIANYKKYNVNGSMKKYDGTFIESCLLAIDMLNNPAMHVVANMEKYNTAGSDFGLLMSAGYDLHVSDGFYRPEKSVKGTSGRSGRDYLNIYEKTATGFQPLFGEKENRYEYHISSPALSADGREIYYAVSRSLTPEIADKSEIGKVLTIRVEIYSRQKKDDGSWSEPIPFRYNNRNIYSVGDPFLTADGNYLFFVSDMPGGKGGLDIYYCKRENEEWSAPKNAGNMINTKGNERYPSFDPAGTFYFSSDGHGGLGGLDIYKTQFANASFFNRQNLGAPVNSSYDDFGISFIDVKNGFFSSNREGGKGADDIYSVQLQRNLQMTLKDNVNKKPLDNVVVEIFDHIAQESHYAVSDSAGVAVFENLKNASGLDITVSKPSYFQVKLYNRKFLELDGIDLPMDKDVLLLTVKDSKTGQPLSHAEVLLYDHNVDSMSHYTSNEQGVVAIPVKKDRTYDIRGYKRNYMATSFSNQSYDELMEKEIVLQKLTVGMTERVDNIYYQFADYRITQDAFNELDNLAEMLKENPSMCIELASHTDSRGVDIYNLVLSARRANAAVSYLVKKGISKDRLTAVGYGATHPANQCGKGVICSDTEHRLNRRTEFTIVYID